MDAFTSRTLQLPLSPSSMNSPTDQVEFDIMIINIDIINIIINIDLNNININILIIIVGTSVGSPSLSQ